MKGVSTKKVLALFMVQALVIFLVYIPASANEIKVRTIPSKQSPMPGDKISVSINVDLSGTAELLGAVSATLTWNSAVFRYINHSGGEGDGLPKMVVNNQKTHDGKLNFASLDPHGSANVVNLLDVRFEVVGEPGSSPELQLEIKEMYAAKTFVDLSPYLDNTVTGVEDELNVMAVPEEYELHQNYPNPFNAGTEIGFSLPEAGQVNLTIFNLLGKKIRTLVKEQKKVGRYNVNWDGKDSKGNAVSSGIYVYRLETGSFTEQKRMLLIK